MDDTARKAAAGIPAGIDYVHGDLLPPPGGTIEVAPGIHWLRMPLPFKLNHINLWLVEDGEGWAIVDCGIAREETQALWKQVWAATLGGRRVTRVIVTHFHPDHMGLAAWHCREWGVELWCTTGEYIMARAMRVIGAEENDRLAHGEFYRRHGVDAGQLELLKKRGNHYPGVVLPLPGAHRRIEHGMTLRIGAHDWRVIVGAGHAPEHACLYCPDLSVLISGDQVLPRITTNVSVWPTEPEANPLARYLGSLDLFRPLPKDALVLPSHDRVFRGLHHRLDMLKHHHDERLDMVVASCKAKPLAAAQLIATLFPGRELDTHQMGFAIGETLSHLHYLESLGRLGREVDAGGMIRFTAAYDQSRQAP
jgi:glyoxylase-like metal-dependent hydrolase (beta-lactamase superfamily II)